jgi:hypothetical protein
LESGSVGAAAASALPGASSLAEELSALFGSTTATDFTSQLGTDLLSSLTGLLGNPAEFLSF